MTLPREAPPLRPWRPGLHGLALVLGMACGAGCASLRPGSGDKETGLASYYHDSLAGRRTASGERYDPGAATCAHRTHPFGTRLRVRNVESGREVTCRVNDRGPFVSGRVVDLSRSLATRLGITRTGVARVEVSVVSRPR